MEISREGFHWVIFYDFKSGLKQKQCIDRLKAAFGNEVPSEATIYNWYVEFKCGRHLVSDEPEVAVRDMLKQIVM